MGESLQKHIGSVFTDEQELIKTLIDLHSPNGIDLDPMFFKGNFYKLIKRPKLIYDIEPIVNDCKKADARKLPISNNIISSMVLDPPFIFGIHGPQGLHQKSYYSSSTHGIFKNQEELSKFYQNILKESYRILKPNGILFFKCQDYTDGKTTLTHCLVYNWATQLGFYAKDLAILYLTKGKVSNPNLKQRHLRKHHSYFFVFQKKRFDKRGNEVNKFSFIKESA